MTTLEGDSNNPAVIRWRLDDLKSNITDLLNWRREVIKTITRNSTKIEELEDANKAIVRKLDSLNARVLGLALSIATGSLGVCLTLVFVR